MSAGFPGAPAGTDLRGLAAIVNRLNLGKLNCTGAVTLAADQPTTAVADSRASVGSFIGLSPLSANAAAEIAAGSLHVSSRATGSFELTHATAALTDRTFAYIIIG